MAAIPQEYSEYCWIEVSKGVRRKIPPEMIQLKELDNWRKDVGDTDIYSSIYRYSVDDPNVGAVLGGLVFDLDCKQNPEKARKEAIALVSDLKNRFEIPETNIYILFTGLKGFRVIVNRRSFNFEPSPYLPLIHKSMVKELVEALGLKTVDLKIYHRRALLRLENSKHPKSGLYEIRLTFEELQKLKIEEIRKLATRPRPIKIAVENRVSPKAHEFYLKHKRLIEESLEQRKEEFATEEIKTCISAPPCVQKRLEIGAEEGIRNISVFQLSVYWTKQGKKLEEVKQLALQFNKRCKPPLDEKEVLTTVESAFRGASENRYSVGCSSEAFYDLCPGKEVCPFFNRKSIEAIFPPEIKAEAEKWLESPDLERKIDQTLALDIAGEEQNRLLAFYLCLSAKKKSPKEKQLIIFSSEPGSGKTTLANAIAQYYRTKKRGRFSEHALDYSDLERYELLYIQEITAGLTKDKSTSISTIRFMSADDQGYEVEVTVKDKESGKFTTETYRIPAITIISTTTDLDLDPQFERRSWTLNLDESEQQTKRVLEFKDKCEDEKFEEKIGLKKPNKDREILKCALNMLEDGEVVIPFKKALRESLRTKTLRVRGDYDKVKNLIRFRAWIHQRQRPFIKAAEGQKIWIALPEDGLKALKLAEQTFRRWVSGIDKRAYEILPELKKLADTPVDETAGVYGITARKLAETRGISQPTARKLLNHLVSRGVLSVQKFGRNNVYQFIGTEEEIENKLKDTIFSENIESLREKFEKETVEWISYYIKFVKIENLITLLSKTSGSSPGSKSFQSLIKEILNSSRENKTDDSSFLKKNTCSPKNEWKMHERKEDAKQSSDHVKPECQNTILFFRRIPPAEKCELCGKFAVEFEIHDIDGLVLRRCPACFEKMRSQGLTLKEIENLKGGGNDER